MFLMDFRSLVDCNGLLGFKTYLDLLLSEIVDGNQINTLHDLTLERLVAYFSTYRNSGDLDFRSSEIYDEIRKLSDKQKRDLAKYLKSILEKECVSPEKPCQTYVELLKNAAVRDD